MDAEWDRDEAEDDARERDRELAVVLDQLRTVGPPRRLFGGDRTGELAERQLLRIALALPEAGKRLAEVEVHVVGLKVGLVLGAASRIRGVDGPVEETEGDGLRPLVGDHKAGPGEDGIVLPRVSFVGDEDVREAVERRIDALGIDDEAREIVVEYRRFQAGALDSGQCLRHRRRLDGQLGPPGPCPRHPEELHRHSLPARHRAPHLRWAPLLRAARPPRHRRV